MECYTSMMNLVCFLLNVFCNICPIKNDPNALFTSKYYKHVNTCCPIFILVYYYSKYHIEQISSAYLHCDCSFTITHVSSKHTNSQVNNIALNLISNASSQRMPNLIRAVSPKSLLSWSRFSCKEKRRAWRACAHCAAH